MVFDGGGMIARAIEVQLLFSLIPSGASVGVRSSSQSGGRPGWQPLTPLYLTVNILTGGMFD